MENPNPFVPVILKVEGEGTVRPRRSGQNALVACCLMVYISQDSIVNRSSFKTNLVMSCSPVASKLSDVLEVLLEEPDKSFSRINVGAVYSLAVERDKQVFTDAVHYCMVLLKQSNRFTSQKSDVLSLEATLMGHEMFERIIGINVQMDVETEDETFAYSGSLENHVKQESETDYSETSLCNEGDLQTTIKEEKQDSMPVTTPAKSASVVEQQSTNISSCFSRRSGPMVVEIPSETMEDFLRHSATFSPQLSANNIDDKQLPPSPVSLSGSECSADNSYKKKPGPRLGSHMSTIPLELKKKVINLVKKHPDWSIGKLRKEARMPQLTSRKQVKTWEKQIDGGGTRIDKYNNISNLTYERFLVARTNSETVTGDMIRQWAIQVARDVYGSNLKFEGTSHWFMNFKKLYNLQWNAANGYFQRNEKEAIKAARLAMKKRRTLRSSGRISMDRK